MADGNPSVNTTPISGNNCSPRSRGSNSNDQSTTYYFTFTNVNDAHTTMVLYNRHCHVWNDTTLRTDKITQTKDIYTNPPFNPWYFLTNKGLSFCPQATHHLISWEFPEPEGCKFLMETDGCSEGLMSPMSWACPHFWVMSGAWPPTTNLSTKIWWQIW